MGVSLECNYIPDLHQGATLSYYYYYYLIILLLLLYISMQCMQSAILFYQLSLSIQCWYCVKMN